jgi:diguanylate cyclase (GGDEF)-like protein/PAS domain S-box-containing protein
MAKAMFEKEYIDDRTGFYEKAAEMIAAHEPGHYILAGINIDNFKLINDRYGVEKGDEVLEYVGRTFYDCLEDDAICARLYADNFAVLYPAGFESSPNVEAAHIRASAPTCIMQRIHLRIGRYLVTDKSINVANMYERAKLATDSGYGRYDGSVRNYDDTMYESILRRNEIISWMTDALNGGEFELWFQPQFNNVTGALIGAEALSRWKHDGTFIPPSEFIPIFEETGFIHEFDTYVRRRACIFIRQQLDAGSEALPVSVNISRLDMLRDDIADILLELTKTYDIPKELLRIEVTETAFSTSADKIITNVRKLTDMGFTVEIDDFGSGYSSLNLLKDMSATVLKLDMGFFKSTDDYDRAQTIVAAVVHMARWLGMTVIAEGVETKEQDDYLKSISCNYIQGYYYGRPMPMEEYERLLSSADTKEYTLKRTDAQKEKSERDRMMLLNEKIRQEHEALETVINHMPGGFVRIRQHGDNFDTCELIYSNKGIEEMTGYSQDEIARLLYTDGFYACICDEDHARVEEFADKIKKSGEDANERYRIRCKDGSWLWVNVSANATLTANGDYYISLFYAESPEQY